MPLALYNSLTHSKQPFRPIDSQNVRMYVCGPTVYDYAHIGNARAVVVFDLLYRVLRHEYGEAHVKYVRNITDVEDKIIDAARANGETIEALTARTERIFQEDMDALGNLRPDVQPRATEHIPQMIAMIDKLIVSGHAYAAEGHVLFRVASYQDYGKLSRRSRKEMRAGARVEIAPYKEDPGDFVLWKPSAPDQPGWDSPWGRGRPGWHIECSAMSATHLGTHFDIHGGGVDLIFPHHENEVAQSVCAHHGEPFVNFWVHNGFLSVDSTKMSKSLGNFVTVHELLNQWDGEIIRLAILGTHYRLPLDWTQQRLREAELTLDRLYKALTLPQTDEGIRYSERLKPRFLVYNALANNLNTPWAIAHLHKLAYNINLTKNADRRDQARRVALQKLLKQSGDLLGILNWEPQEWFHRSKPSPKRNSVNIATQLRVSTNLEIRVTRSDYSIQQFIDQRARARSERRFEEADRIRSQLATEGVILEDWPDRPTTWRRA